MYVFTINMIRRMWGTLSHIMIMSQPTASSISVMLSWPRGGPRMVMVRVELDVQKAMVLAVPHLIALWLSQGMHIPGTSWPCPVFGLDGDVLSASWTCSFITAHANCDLRKALEGVAWSVSQIMKACMSWLWPQ